ncbi:MAG: hypothetical protein JWN27_2931 [Candidatus Eremiobacteraeota bacterium]|nr:hypothetical protein [Candidatus Eremiobacteraeota bacterium]
MNVRASVIRGARGSDGAYVRGLTTCAGTCACLPSIRIAIAPGAEDREHENVRRPDPQPIAIAKPPSIWKRLGAWLP